MVVGLGVRKSRRSSYSVGEVVLSSVSVGLVVGVRVCRIAPVVTVRVVMRGQIQMMGRLGGVLETDYVGCDLGVVSVVAVLDDVVAVLSTLVDVHANLASC